MLTFILMSLLALWASLAQAAPLGLTPADAALVMDAGSRPGPGTVVRCTDAQQVGLWVTDATTMDLQGVTVENCPVGLAYEAPPPSAADAPARLQARPSIAGLTASGPRCLVGLWIRGSQGNGPGEYGGWV